MMANPTKVDDLGFPRFGKPPLGDAAAIINTPATLRRTETSNPTSIPPPHGAPDSSLMAEKDLQHQI